MDDNNVVDHSDRSNLFPATTAIDESNANKTQETSFSAEMNTQLENDLFLLLKSHIDSLYKLNQINQSRIISFDRFRRYCQRVAQFGDESTVVDLEQFRNEYNRFDRKYRYWSKQIREFRKQIKSTDPYDVLYELYAKIENLDQTFSKLNNLNNTKKHEDRYRSDDQIYPEISINVIEPSINSRSTQSKGIQCDFSDVVKTSKPESAIDSLDNIDDNSATSLDGHFSAEYSSDSDFVYNTRNTRSRKKTTNRKQTTATVKKTTTTTQRQSKAQSSKRGRKPNTKTAIPKSLPKKKSSVKRKICSDSETEDIPKNVKTKKEKKPKTPRVYRCEAEGCQYSTTNSWNMNLHRRTHSDARPFKCDKCEVAFKIKGDLRVHQNIHEGVRFHCTFEGCTVNYATRKAILKHIKIFHTKEAVLLRCDWEGCDYTSYSGPCLRIHQAVHTDERPFKCPDCELAFKSRANLWSHKLTHQNDRRFKCDFEGCDYTTYNREYLQNHRVVHTGERQFKCVWPECGQAFKSSSNLWSHKMMHENQRRYKCTWEGCDYAGNLCGSLQRHEEAVHGKKRVATSNKTTEQQQTNNNNNNNMSNSELKTSTTQIDLSIENTTGTMVNCNNILESHIGNNSSILDTSDNNQIHSATTTTLQML